MFTSEIGIDLGTANILVYSKNKGILFNEPSVVAVDRISKKIIAVGKEAKEMVGKTPKNISIIRPLREGVIADYEITTEMLKIILKTAAKKAGISLRKPNVVVCIPYGSTTVDQRAIKDALRNAGAKTVVLIEEPIAAAVGAGLAVDEPVANLVVNIGGGTTEVGIISLGGIVACNSVKVGGDQLDDDILQYVRKTYNILIGQKTAETIKMEIGYALIEHEEKKIDVRGRDLVTGLPKTITLSSHEISKAMKESLLIILDAIKMTLEQCPAELSGDIVDLGITLTGGGSLLNGLKEWISNEIHVPVNLAENPLESVVIGTGKSLAFLGKLKQKV